MKALNSFLFLLSTSSQSAKACDSCDRDQRLHKEHSMDYQFLRYVAHFNKDYQRLEDYRDRKEHFEHTEKLLSALSQELDT